MTALALRALSFAERYGVTIAVVAGDRLSWQSQGPTPGRALEALKAAKGELIDLLVRYRLDSAGGLAGDDLLAALQVAGFAVRRYGANAALDDALGGALDRAPATSLLYAFADKQAEYSLALRALRAPDCLEGNAHAAVREEAAAIGARAGETDEKPSAAMKARDLLGHLRDLGFRAYLDRGALYLADTTGWRRNPFRFVSPTLLFQVLNAGLDDDPALLNLREDSP
jgi:hypothetical protein